MNLTEEQIKQFTEKVKGVVDAVMEEKLASVVGSTVAKETRAIVEKMRIERLLFGQDRSGLDTDQKKSFVELVKAAAGFKTKANEALISETDSRGGYLVPKEVAAAILRIAASVGLVLSQARKWPMGSDALDIPAYTGSFLEGEYLGVDAAGNVTGITFAQSQLVIKKWQLAFVVGNDLMADASVDLGDWLLALGGEALANMVDKQAFVGTGNPFVGLLNHADVPAYTLPTGEDTFAEFDPVVDGSDVVGQLEESVLDGAAWYMHRTVWSKIRAKKDTAGNFILPNGGAASQQVLANNPTGGGVKPAGEMMGFPVFTSRHLPKNADTAVSTKYIVFGNFQAAAYGDKGELVVAQHDSGSFGGKEIGLADQRALVYKHRHALTIALPAAFVAVKTAAS
jgi:HK97 family phage major capsid protein